MNGGHSIWALLRSFITFKILFLPWEMLQVYLPSLVLSQQKLFSFSAIAAILVGRTDGRWQHPEGKCLYDMLTLERLVLVRSFITGRSEGPGRHISISISPHLTFDLQTSTRVRNKEWLVQCVCCFLYCCVNRKSGSCNPGKGIRGTWFPQVDFSQRTPTAMCTQN